MYRFHVSISHFYNGNYDVSIPQNGKMDLTQAIDAVYGHFGKIFPDQIMTLQFISLTIRLKK